MTHEQEEKAEIPFFKSGKHPTKKQMAGKMKTLCETCRTGHNGKGCSTKGCTCSLCNR
jgi:hypothetical protein